MNVFSPREDTYEALANALSSAYASKENKRHADAASRPEASTFPAALAKR